jgi:hypothetical protein
MVSPTTRLGAAAILNDSGKICPASREVGVGAGSAKGCSTIDPTCAFGSRAHRFLTTPLRENQISDSSLPPQTELLASPMLQVFFVFVADIRQRISGSQERRRDSQTPRLGVAEVVTYAVKRLDADYFDESE